jgi:hypothetical protein
MTTGLYLLIGFGVVLCAAGWIGLRWERERVQVGDGESVGSVWRKSGEEEE